MEPGASARPDPGRYFSTFLTLIPGATSQETVRFQPAPHLQFQSMCEPGERLGLGAARSHLGTPLGARALLCSAHLAGRTEGTFSTSLNLKDKRQNLRAKISHPLPKGRRGSSRRPAHTFTCAFGAGGQLLGVFPKEAQRCPSFGSQQGLKSRPALWPSVKERQETPALPSKAQVSL